MPVDDDMNMDETDINACYRCGEKLEPEDGDEQGGLCSHCRWHRDKINEE